MKPPYSTLPISEDRGKYTLEDWEDYRFRISFFSEDKGATWRVLQHCVEIGHEASDVVDATFRACLNQCGQHVRHLYDEIVVFRH